MLEIRDHATRRAVDDDAKSGLGEGVHAVGIVQRGDVDVERWPI